ncbi:CTD kinase subunit gamma CTK3-domain-containing protein [Trametes gibbosa]|nr:CTD kinase subunit gamma CTK3-domain-containing protein [Trametes gibbosa]
MDPFEVRMQFLGLLRRLDASQQSIKKIVGYAVKYFPSCGEDLWDCMLEECQKGSLNNRINILHLLDSLCEASLVIKPLPGVSHSSSSSSYATYVSRDLQKILDGVVPDGRQGLPNLMSTKQILESWRTKRIVDPQKVEDAITVLEERRAAAVASATRASSPDSAVGALTRDDIKRRMEEDRERHKRLRERRWVQPIGNALPAVLPPLASFLPLTDSVEGPGGAEDANAGLGVLDIEFDNDWEATSDWNEDDDEAVEEENELCFVDASDHGASDEQAMDLS